MRKHPVRKFLGLTVLYAAIIVGIFVLQFKTESVINKTIGKIHITLTQGENESHEIVLRNQFVLTFNGFTFFSDEETPALLYSTDKKESSPLVLSSVEELSSTSAAINFTDGSCIELSQILDDDENVVQMNISSHPSQEGYIISIPYSIQSSVSINETFPNRLQFVADDQNYEFVAYAFEGERICLEEGQNTASYSEYNPVKVFTLDMLTGLELADENMYKTNVSHIRKSYISKFNTSFANDGLENLSELQIVTYIAEMAANGKLSDAMNKIPSSYQKSNKRTYISAPYFGNLSAVNNSLTVNTSRYGSLINSAIKSSSLDVFATDDISSYILREKNTDSIRKLLAIPASILVTKDSDDTDEPRVIPMTLAQAAGILNVYADLYEKDKETAAKLESVIDICISRITQACSLSEEETFEIKEDNETPSTINLIKTGNALSRVAKIVSRNDLRKIGYLIANTGFAQLSSPTLEQLVQIYPVVVTDNTYYPHMEILGYYGAKAVWAWTCAQSITYDIKSDAVVNISIKYPLGNSQYLILNNIPNFHSKIEIQQQMFRTDPRFETYNSSGYVYKSDLQTLFLKSRHKSETETIRLFCDPASNFTKLQ